MSNSPLIQPSLHSVVRSKVIAAILNSVRLDAPMGEHPLELDLSETRSSPDEIHTALIAVLKRSFEIAYLRGINVDNPEKVTVPLPADALSDAQIRFSHEAAEKEFSDKKMADDVIRRMAKVEILHEAPPTGWRARLFNPQSSFNVPVPENPSDPNFLKKARIRELMQDAIAKAAGEAGWRARGIKLTQTVGADRVRRITVSGPTRSIEALIGHAKNNKVAESPPVT